MGAMTGQDLIVGSGNIYIKEYTGSIPDKSVLETDTYLFGRTKGGATLTYSQESTNIKDDCGYINETFMTSDDLKFKLGAFVVVGDIDKLCPTATKTVNDGIITVKLGGVGNDNGKKYIVRFVHKSKPLRITLIGKNEGDLELAFSAEDAITVEPTFTASAIDGAGHLCEIVMGTSESVGTDAYRVVDTFADGADPSELGYYEVADGVYSLTADTEVEAGKVYYIKL